MISAEDAISFVSKQLPKEGIEFQEFVSRVAHMCGASDEIAAEWLNLAESDGIMPDDIVKIGSCGTGMH